VLKKSVAIVCVLLLVTGCSRVQSQPQSPAQISGAPATAADVQFARSISKNHVKSIQVSQFPQQNSNNAELIKFAATLTDSGQEEARRLLEIFDPGSDRNAEATPLKALDDAHVRELWEARGAAFDKLFVTAMIGHYGEAVAIAQTELKDGSNETAISVAKDVIASRTKLISDLNALQAQLK
jgi:uncharacterized protein (DUF305 family)